MTHSGMFKIPVWVPIDIIHYWLDKSPSIVYTNHPYMMPLSSPRSPPEGGGAPVFSTGRTRSIRSSAIWCITRFYQIHSIAWLTTTDTTIGQSGDAYGVHARSFDCAWSDCTRCSDGYEWLGGERYSSLLGLAKQSTVSDPVWKTI